MNERIRQYLVNLSEQIYKARLDATVLMSEVETFDSTVLRDKLASVEEEISSLLGKSVPEDCPF